MRGPIERKLPIRQYEHCILWAVLLLEMDLNFTSHGDPEYISGLIKEGR
jgi:hypothetical protein